jgi:hypothetical protein
MIPRNNSCGDLCPEVSLLLCCARTRMGQEYIQQVVSLCNDRIDWDYVLTLATAHRVLPLVYLNLKRACPETVPAAILAQLRRSFASSAGHSLRLAAELRRILRAFADHRVDAVSFKGPTLATEVYGELALRAMRDLDLLVREADVERAKHLLMSLGFTARSAQTSKSVSWTLRHCSEVQLWHCQTGIKVDMHWRLFPGHMRFPLGFDAVWRRSSTVSLDDYQVRNLSLEDLLLVLCMHATKHTGRLSCICDVAELVNRRSATLDWGEVMGQARRLGTQRITLLGLLLAHDLLQARVPLDVVALAVRSRGIRWLSERVRHELFPGRGQLPEGLRSQVDREVFALRLRERWVDRVCRNIDVAFNPRLPRKERWRWLMPAFASVCGELASSILAPLRMAHTMARRSKSAEGE